MRRWAVGALVGFLLAAGWVMAGDDPPRQVSFQVGAHATGDALVVREAQATWTATMAGPDPIPDSSGQTRGTARITWSGPLDETWWVDSLGHLVANGSYELRRETKSETNPVAAEVDYRARKLTMSGDHACLWLPWDAWHGAVRCRMTPTTWLTADFGTPRAKGSPAVALSVNKDAAWAWPANATSPATVSSGTSEWIIETRARGTSSAWTPAFGAAPELDYRAPAAWGPDEQGADLPFSASEAYQAAHGSLDWPDFREWANAHPQHVVVARSFWRLYALDHEELQWELEFTAPGSAFGLRATKSVPGTTILDVPSQADALATYRFTSFPPAPGRPEPDALPSAWPTLLSIAERWRALSGPAFADADLSAVVYSWRCETECKRDDLRIGAYRWDGSNSLVGVAQATGGESEWLYSSVRMNGTGSISEIDQWLERADTLDNPSPAQQAPVQVTQPRAPGLAFNLQAAIAAGALAGLVAWFVATIRGGPWGLFSRIRDDELESHPVRRAIIDAVGDEPGIRYQQLRRRLEISNGSLHHHVDRLLRAGRLRVHRSAGATQYFTAQAESLLPHVLLVAHAPSRRTILKALATRGALTAADLQDVLGGLSRSATYEHVKRLEDAGLVTRSDGVIALSTLGRDVAGGSASK